MPLEKYKAKRSFDNTQVLGKGINMEKVIKAIN